MLLEMVCTKRRHSVYKKEKKSKMCVKKLRRGRQVKENAKRN
jgi:hypothetical protein